MTSCNRGCRSVEAMRFVASTLGIAAAASVAGCGMVHASRDVNAFVRQGNTPQQRAVLHSIGVYRTTPNYVLACSLVTPHFLQTRFDGQIRECESTATQTPHTLPRSARVAAIGAGRAQVRVAEVTGTRSIYRMEQLGGVWKVDDIVVPRNS